MSKRGRCPVQEIKPGDLAKVGGEAKMAACVVPQQTLRLNSVQKVFMPPVSEPSGPVKPHSPLLN